MDFSRRARYRGFVFKKRAFLTVTLLSLVPFGAHANVHHGSAGPRGQNYDASLAVAQARAATPAGSTSTGVALSRDPARGVPAMLVAPSAALPAAGSTPEEAARFHLMNTRDAYKVSRAALSSARLRFVHDLGRGGIIVSLRQMLSGIEVFHGDVKVLLDRYALADPLAGLSVGTFHTPLFQTLYTDLVAASGVSLVAAVKVGVQIEELDISDLASRMAATDNTDIQVVYDNLLRGSRNHLRAYMSMVVQQGGSYAPQYITPLEFDAIVNSPMEKGR